MVPVDPLAGGKERHRVRKGPNMILQWERKDHYREARWKNLLQQEQGILLLLQLDGFLSLLKGSWSHFTCLFFRSNLTRYHSK